MSPSMAERPGSRRPGHGALLVGAALTSMGQLVRAEGPQDRFWAQLEYFRPTIDSSARLDAPGTRLPGTRVSMEDDLGLNDTTAR